MTLTRGHIKSLIKSIHKKTPGTGMKDDVPAVIRKADGGKLSAARPKPKPQTKTLEDFADLLRGSKGAYRKEKEQETANSKVNERIGAVYKALTGRSYATGGSIPDFKEGELLLPFIPRTDYNNVVIDRGEDEGTFSQPGETVDLNQYSKENIDDMLLRVLSMRRKERGKNSMKELNLDALSRFYNTLQARAKGRDYGSKFAKGGSLNGGEGQAAALSEGEYVIPADVVSMLGDGNSDAGARILDKFCEQIRKTKGKHLVKGKQAPPLS